MVETPNNEIDYTGPTASKAARLSLTAPGGQILVSTSFRNEIVRELHTISNVFIVLLFCFVCLFVCCSFLSNIVLTCLQPPPELLPVGTIYLKGFGDPEFVYQVLSPSLVNRHKKYMAQSDNQSTIVSFCMSHLNSFYFIHTRYGKTKRIASTACFRITHQHLPIIAHCGTSHLLRIRRI
jgi:hypothetical protein